MICKKCGFNFDGAFCPNCGEAAVIENVVNEPVYVDAEPVGKNPGKGKGIAGMILGIISMLSYCCSCCAIIPYIGWVAAIGSFILPPICSIIGLILSSSGLKASKAAGFGNGMAKVGKILSIIALVLFILMVVGAIILVVVIGGGSILAFVGSAASMDSMMASPEYYY